MGIKRVVDTDFWNDSKVIDYFSPEDKYFMLYLLTNPYTTQLGIYELNIKKAAFETGYSTEALNVLLDRFENKYGMIKYSKKTNEIAIKNYLRHSIIKGGKPVEDLLNKEISNVKDKNLLAFIFSNLSKYDNLNETVNKITEAFCLIMIMTMIMTMIMMIRGTNRITNRQETNLSRTKKLQTYTILSVYHSQD